MNIDFNWGVFWAIIAAVAVIFMLPWLMIAAGWILSSMFGKGPAPPVHPAPKTYVSPKARWIIIGCVAAVLVLALLSEIYGF